jgi:hypothetical protein
MLGNFEMWNELLVSIDEMMSGNLQDSSERWSPATTTLTPPVPVVGPVPTSCAYPNPSGGTGTDHDVDSIRPYAGQSSSPLVDKKKKDYGSDYYHKSTLVYQLALPARLSFSSTT